ncbi:DUF2330 domain-containing protein [Actinophytocola sediminis]
MRMIRLFLVPLVPVLWLVGFGPGVAGACACGAVITDERLTDVEETALVQLDAGQESVTLNIGGAIEADEAAFIMPVPTRSTFELADGAVFAELDELSAPRVEYEDVVIDGDGAGAGAPGDQGVTVTDHVDVGPFEVAQLTGANAGSVADWLARNDFVLSDDLATALTPYLAQDWLVLAVRLTPDGAETFADGLPSMRFTFPVDEPVYPMRLSATAEYAQPFRLYVLAEHRMDVSNPAPADDPAELTYAGWVDPATLTDYPELAELVDDRRFLTRYDARFAPEDITGDITFTRAASDEAYRAVVVERRYVQGSSTGLVVAVVAGAVVLLGAGGLGVARLRRSRR